METFSHAIFFSPLFFKDKRKNGLIDYKSSFKSLARVCSVKSSGNQTGFNRRKPWNRLGRLTWAWDRSIQKTRPINRSGIELQRSTDLCLVDQHMLRIFSLFWIYLPGSTGSNRTVSYGIDRSIREKKLQTLDFEGEGFLIFFNYFS